MSDLGFEGCVGASQAKKNREPFQVGVEPTLRLGGTGDGEEGEEDASEECGGQITRLSKSQIEMDFRWLRPKSLKPSKLGCRFGSCIRDQK